MRRIVTGHTADGRSTVVSDDVIEEAGMTQIWQTADVPRFDREPHRVGFEAPPGGATWSTVRVAPWPLMRAALASGAHGVDPEGWHTTDTVDFVHIAAGTIVLGLEECEVELHAGDCVVQNGTRHAWWNRTDETVHMLSVSLSAAAADESRTHPPG